MTQIGVHKDNVLILAVREPVDVSRSQSEFASSGLQHNLVVTINSLEILYLILGSIGRSVVDDDHLHFDFTIHYELAYRTKLLTISESTPSASR